jgi:low molecular weight protein-tyrosine phosphatase
VKTVLFLCTGNFYRSRFAEILFNHLCCERSLRYTADSRALAVERGRHCNFGPLSRHSAEALQARGIPLPADRYPKQAIDADFVQADFVIAVKELEHRPLVAERFPAFMGKVRYWHVHDLDAAAPADALAQIEQHVRQLIDELAPTGAARAGSAQTAAGRQ